MRLIEDIKIMSNADKGSVLVIGNFDGVHKGHQKLLAAGKAIADEKQVPLAVMTFEPHPQRLFRPDDRPSRITPPELKRDRLAAFGVDILFSMTFDWDFASQPYEGFIRHILDEGITPSQIIVGYDFQFGQLRKGTPEDLKAAGYNVTVLEKVADDGDAAYSSSRARQYLRHGDIKGANEVLGWDWEMRGIVKKGDQRGRELGFPTANVALNDTIHPAYGVYATWVKIVEDGPDAPWMPAATNIGIRPMFELQIGQIESYIFDFDRDIYDMTLRVKPVERIRGEAKFETLDSLIAQIKKDCEKTAEILGLI